MITARLLAILAAAMILFASADACAEWRRLSDQELVDFLSGANLNLQQVDGRKMKQHYLGEIAAPGEKADMRFNSGSIDPGTWWVEDGQFHLQYNNAVGIVRRDFAIEAEGDEVARRTFAVERDGSRYRFFEVSRVYPGDVFKEIGWRAPSMQVWRFPPPRQ